ncbi:hypothetical protein BDV26DRAFT_259212 [Aspergillus bertholletiae]|uniref:Alpha/Beta hydrolase protein n=1 Tax=Aspergillus bertholletiae TaxID=1226010 RepID=A0A5N7BCJ8_9EURO|nr:hypothetical protein BDV26DRAFT_259212 [Aspergillus bertholletiae]
MHMTSPEALLLLLLLLLCSPQSSRYYSPFASFPCSSPSSIAGRNLALINLQPGDAVDSDTDHTFLPQKDPWLTSYSLAQPSHVIIYYCLGGWGLKVQ